MHKIKSAYVEPSASSLGGEGGGEVVGLASASSSAIALPSDFSFIFTPVLQYIRKLSKLSEAPHPAKVATKTESHFGHRKQSSSHIVLYPAVILREGLSHIHSTTRTITTLL